MEVVVLLILFGIPLGVIPAMICRSLDQTPCKKMYGR